MRCVPECILDSPWQLGCSLVNLYRRAMENLCEWQDLLIGCYDASAHALQPFRQILSTYTKKEFIQGADDDVKDANKLAAVRLIVKIKICCLLSPILYSQRLPVTEMTLEDIIVRRIKYGSISITSEIKRSCGLVWSLTQSFLSAFCKE